MAIYHLQTGASVSFLPEVKAGNKRVLLQNAATATRLLEPRLPRKRIHTHHAYAISRWHNTALGLGTHSMKDLARQGRVQHRACRNLGASHRQTCKHARVKQRKSTHSSDLHTIQRRPHTQARTGNERTTSKVVQHHHLLRVSLARTLKTLLALKPT